MRSKNERVELEMKILRYRALARQIATDPETQRRIRELISDRVRPPQPGTHKKPCPGQI
jgi:hypothetical protein